MKLNIRIKEKKKRYFYCKNEVTKKTASFLLSSLYFSDVNPLVIRKIYKNKGVVRASVSFIHNRCVITLRDVLFSACLKCRGIRLNDMVHLDVLAD